MHDAILWIIFNNHEKHAYAYKSNVKFRTISFPFTYSYVAVSVVQQDDEDLNDSDGGEYTDDDDEHQELQKLSRAVNADGGEDEVRNEGMGVNLGLLRIHSPGIISWGIDS